MGRFLSLMAQVQTLPAAPDTAVDFTWLFVKMLLALGIVTVLAILILKYAVPATGLMKRFQHGKQVRILGKQTIEPKKTLYIVSVGKKYLLLGASDSGIRLITELTKEDVEEVSSR